MDSDIAISLSGVSKCFKLYDRPADRLKDLLFPTRQRSRDFWALTDVSAEIKQGQTIGLIGKNGSGKSTLLQLIVGTLTPTKGQVKVQGRIAALLELGSGFNPEFTGRQNIFFNGRLLGLSQAEVEARFDRIVAFADIGEMLEQPVKTYSSGMFVRLAFAVVINIDPDILIVDEALAVGDIYFQQKCFQRIHELRDRGVTVLFVSHDSGTMLKLCDRALLLEQGQVTMDGDPKPVIDLYEAKMLQQFEQTLDANEADPPDAEPVTNEAIASSHDISLPPAAISDDQQIQVKFIRILDEQGKPISTITSGSKIQIAIGIWSTQAIENPHIGFKIRNRQGEVMFETNTHCMGQTPDPIATEQLIEARFQCVIPLAEDQYSLSIGIADGAIGEGAFRRILLYAHDLAVLTVLRNPRDITWSGMVNLQPQLQISTLKPN